MQHPYYWQRGRSSPANKILLGVVEALVLSVPLTTSYSVIVGRVLGVKLIIRKVVQYALARYTIILGTALPFIAALIFLYLHRENTLASLVSGSRPFVVGAVLIAGAVGLTVRERVMNIIDRRYFHEQYDSHSILAGLISAARHAEDCESANRGLTTARFWPDNISIILHPPNSRLHQENRTDY